ncbi:MAG: hypothetical protein Q8N04_15695 [Nitrospira sp.]|nr:hypothetical protein [Nitrospira sp.]
MRKPLLSVLLVGLLPGLLSACMSFAETPGERFQKVMKEMAELCQSKKLIATDSRCILPKMQPADPLATEEGRFAQSIKIPNPVSTDSGYKSGMTSEQYFEHLCKTEAGEFIYKTVENVEGFHLMRPRKRATDYEMEHLYGLEAPYVEVHGEYHSPEEYFVQPHLGKYQFLEVPLAKSQDASSYRRYYRDENAHPGKDYQTAINGRFVRVPYIVAEKEAQSLNSKYGVTWRGITRPHDRDLGIAGSELIVLNLETNEILAVRRGFKRTGGVRNLTGIWWLAGQTCPKLSDRPDHWFIRDVLKPAADLKKKEK